MVWVAAFVALWRDPGRFCNFSLWLPAKCVHSKSETVTGNLAGVRVPSARQPGRLQGGGQRDGGRVWAPLGTYLPVGRTWPWMGAGGPEPMIHKRMEGVGGRGQHLSHSRATRAGRVIPLPGWLLLWWWNWWLDPFSLLKWWWKLVPGYLHPHHAPPSSSIHTSQPRGGAAGDRCFNPKCLSIASVACLRGTNSIHQ